MKLSDVNLPGERAHGIVRGHTGASRAGTPGQSHLDSQGHDVTAPDTYYVGATVTGEDGKVAYVTITGTGEEVINAAGEDLDYGDVVAQQGDGSVTKTTVPQYTGRIGVVVRGGFDGDPVSVVFQGRVEQVNTTGPVTGGNFAETSTVAGQATESAVKRTGSFAQFLADGTNPPASLFGFTSTSDPATGTTEVGGDLDGTLPDPTVVGLKGTVIQAWSGALSNPPTEAELEAVLGPPATTEGVPFLILDGSNDRAYHAVAGGGTYFYVPLILPLGGGVITPSILTLTSAPEGGWSWFEDPRAIQTGGYLYVAYNQGGNLKIAVFDDSSGSLVNTVTVASAFEYDDHDVPTLTLRTDGKLLIAYSKHLGANIYTRISTTSLATDPDLSDGFASAVSHSATFGTTQSTYPSLEALSNNDGGGARLFLWWREHVSGTAYLRYAFSADNGATWSGGASNILALPYTKVATNGVGEIHFASTGAPGSGANEGKVWHFYRESATFWMQDGTNITAPLPLGPTDIEEVWDGTGAGDACWISDIALTPGGDPVIAFVRYPGGDEDDHRAMYAAWDGAAWDVNEICVMGNPGGVSGEYPAGVPNATYNPGVQLDKADPQIVYVARWISGQVEMFRYTTANGGTTFTAEQLTAGSTAKNIRPVAVRGADNVKAVWLYGSYTNYISYSLGIRGIGS